MENKKIKAYFLIKKGVANQAFQLKELALPHLLANQVSIEVEAFGLNYADVMARNGLYREAPPMPCVIGYEVVGTIKQIGSSVDATWIGKRVVAFTRFGGYAKQAQTTIDAVVPIDAIPAEIALGLCTQAVTAYYMHHYFSPIQKGKRVLIHAAAGGVGTVLIQLAKAVGAIVYAKVSSDEKVELVKSLGADYAMNYKQAPYEITLAKLLDGKKLDASFNPVGGSTCKKDLQLLGAGGKLYLFGGSELAEGKWGILSTLNFVRKMGLILPIGLMMTSKSIIGINMLKVADQSPEVLQLCMAAVVQLYQAGVIQPQIGGVYTSDELAKAHTFLESGKSTGKLVVKW